METKLYSISIALYSDELYPDDYEDGQENTYCMTEEQYKTFNELKLTCAGDIHEWCVENLDDDNIYLAQEFIDGIADVDQYVFDYNTQKYLVEIR
jgi:hypothetical protein